MSPVLVTRGNWGIRYGVNVLTVVRVTAEKDFSSRNVECVGMAGLKPGFSVFWRCFRLSLGPAAALWNVDICETLPRLGRG